jgi:hypothetical protein
VLQADAPEPVRALVERIRSGPPASRVQAVECEPLGDEPLYDGFQVVR